MNQDAYYLACAANLTNPDQVTRGDVLATLLLSALVRERDWLFRMSLKRFGPAARAEFHVRAKEIELLLNRVAKDFGLPRPRLPRLDGDADCVLDFDRRSVVLENIVGACQRLLAQGERL